MIDRTSKRFRMTLTLTPEEAAYVRKSPSDEFAPEALDVNLRFEFEGQPPNYPPADHRITPENTLANIPVFDFLTSLVSACSALQRSQTADERVYVTSTDYYLELQRREAVVGIELVHLSPDGIEKVVGKSTMELHEFVSDCAGSGRLFLLTLNDMNRDLAKNPRVRDLRERISRVLPGTARARQ